MAARLGNRPLFFLHALQHHLAAKHGENSKGNPVIDHCQIAAGHKAHQPPGNGHERFDAAKNNAGFKRLSKLRAAQRRAFAKGMGLTTEELMKLVEEGKITAQDIFPALAQGLNELYGSAPQAQTLSQEITNIKNAFSDMADEIGQAGGLSALKVAAR